MSDDQHIAQRFLALHHTEKPLLMPNPWDVGSAKLLAHLGFPALATTSGGFAASLGSLDGTVTRDEAIAHAAAITAATGLPVNGDFEDCFADDTAGVARTIELAIDAGVAGCSIEDYSGGELLDIDAATERVAAAAQAAGGRLVLTARAENFIRDNPDIDDTIARLVAYQDAGADVLYAPALRGIDDVRAILAAVDRPLNVLTWPGAPPVAELADAGVSRISVGSAFALASYGALLDCATELRDAGTYGYLERARHGYLDGARAAFAAD